jgi:hypothetical protein
MVRDHSLNTSRGGGGGGIVFQRKACFAILNYFSRLIFHWLILRQTLKVSAQNFEGVASFRIFVKKTKCHKCFLKGFLWLFHLFLPHIIYLKK